MKQGVNLQDQFLNTARREGVLITVFLVNGYQIKGYVKGFDSYKLVLDADDKQQLVYKHAISTIIPSSVIDFEY